MRWPGQYGRTHGAAPFAGNPLPATAVPAPRGRGRLSPVVAGRPPRTPPSASSSASSSRAQTIAPGVGASPTRAPTVVPNVRGRRRPRRESGRPARASERRRSFTTHAAVGALVARATAIVPHAGDSPAEAPEVGPTHAAVGVLVAIVCSRQWLPREGAEGATVDALTSCFVLWFCLVLEGTRKSAAHRRWRSHAALRRLPGRSKQGPGASTGMPIWSRHAGGAQECRCGAHLAPARRRQTRARWRREGRWSGRAGNWRASLLRGDGMVADFATERKEEGRHGAGAGGASRSRIQSG